MVTTASLLGSAGIGAASNLIGNLFNRSSTNKTNATNLKIAQMNNEWSEKMMQKQMDYNTDMWNKQNDYNDPSKQVERLKSAGINPALALSGIGTGQASSASSPSLPSPSASTMQPNRYDFSGVGAAMQSVSSNLLQRDKQAAEIRFIDKQADWYDAQAKAQITKAYAEAEGHTAKTYYQNIMNSWAPKQFNAEWMNTIRQGWQMDAQLQNTIRQGLLLDKDIAAYDARLNGDLSEQLSRISLNYANGKLSLQQADKALRETWSEIEKRIGMKIDNDVKAHTRDAVIERAKQPQNMYQMAHDIGKQVRSDYDYISSGAKRWFDKNIVKPSKRSWKDTRRAFGLYGY